jgi:hypothetical protein
MQELGCDQSQGITGIVAGQVNFFLKNSRIIQAYSSKQGQSEMAVEIIGSINPVFPINPRPYRMDVR